MSFHSSAVTLSGAEVPSVPLVPATFWQRLAAALIDFVLTSLVVVSLGKLCAISKALADVFVVPLALFAFVYSSVGHALYGRTVGKHLLKIRVVRLDGTRIGWNEAVRRSSVDGLFGVVWLIGLEAALSQLTADTFRGQSWSTLYKSLAALIPPYVSSIMVLSGYWGWSEIATMLLNRQRRALHDFIGSTRVVRVDDLDAVSGR
jgi:uncharacterized RDD family membrane protein YckC